MEREKVEKWLNRIAKTVKQYNNIPDYEEGVLELCGRPQHYKSNAPYAQLYRGLHEVAELLGLEVFTDYESEDNICYRFVYKGVDFIQLDDKEGE